MTDKKEYASITESGLEALKGDLRSMGIVPPDGDSGVIEYQGVRLAIDYEVAKRTLTIRIAEKPGFIPESLIWQLLDARVQKCLGR